VVVVNPGSQTYECSYNPVVITASTGIITSPGYDEGQYPNDAFCQWLITAPAGNVRCRFIQPTDVFYWRPCLLGVVSASLYRAERLWDRPFACSICRSARVSSGNTADWIWMPFGVVNGVGLSMGVLDFGGDRRRERGSLGEYNAEMVY